MSVAVVMTGGTIAKSYDPASALLHNFELKAKELVQSLRADDLSFTFIDLLRVDSIDLGDTERSILLAAITRCCGTHDAVLVTHGTDGMAESGELLCSKLGLPPVPVVFTGAMVPYAVHGSDAIQNVSEALLALRLLPSGIYVVIHNRILRLPGAYKDHKSLTFAAV